jgi:hypothetical protein
MQRTGTRAILNTIGGSIELPILSPSDFLALGRQCRQQRKGDLIQNARAAGAQPDAVLKLLNEFDARPWRHADTIGYLNTEAGASAAVLRSLRKNRPRASQSDLDGLGIPPGRMLEAAAAVCRLRLVESRPKAEGQVGPFAQTGVTAGASPPAASQSNPPIASGDSKPT